MDGVQNTNTSLKQLIQSMNPSDGEFLQGTVIQESPLKIQIANDEKLILNERITIVPWHLTDYKTTMTITGGTVSGETNYAGTEDVHRHSLESFSDIRADVTVYNALKLGDVVHILSLNHGKKYFVLDRVVE